MREHDVLAGRLRNQAEKLPWAESGVLELVFLSGGDEDDGPGELLAAVRAKLKLD